MNSRVVHRGYPAVLLVLLAAISEAQVSPSGGPGPRAPRTGKAAALYDITGYWVAVVSEDWRYRMITPRKGDYSGILLNAEGRKLADAWDPAKDEAAGEQCRSYRVPSLMRVPGRIHITWQDDQTLKIETDACEQVRLLHFDSSKASSSPWQGVFKAQWEMVPVGRGSAPVGSLKVVTNHLKPGYLRKNGVPYSANALLTEYFDRVNEPNGDAYLLITTTVEDPAYPVQPFLTSSHYRKTPDNSGWKSARSRFSSFSSPTLGSRPAARRGLVFLGPICRCRTRGHDRRAPERGEPNDRSQGACRWRTQRHLRSGAAPEVSQWGGAGNAVPAQCHQRRGQHRSLPALRRDRRGRGVQHHLVPEDRHEKRRQHSGRDCRTDEFPGPDGLSTR